MSRLLIYDIDERPPLGEALPLGLQHLVAMLLGNITPPLVIAMALGLAIGETTALIQTALIVSGLATLVQAYPIGPVGGRLPIVMGTSVVFMGAIITITQEYNLATAFGACLVAAPVELVLGAGLARARRLFPPLVSSIVVMLIGLTLMPIGFDYAAGGVGADDYGSLAHLGIAALVFSLTLALNQFGRGLWRYTAVLFGVIAGYAVAYTSGMVDLAPVREGGLWAVPRPIPFGLEFHAGPILLMVVIYTVSAIETVGDISAVVATTGREATSRELRGGLFADGVMSALAALVGAFPNTSFSQNVGLASFTGVVSRHVTALCGIFLVALGAVPAVSAVFASLPPSVVGGSAVIMFAMIFSSGVAIAHRDVAFNQRNLVILAVAVGLGLGVELRPDALREVPEWARTFLGSGLVVGAVSGAVMHAVFPEE